jgi:hypothetical protein
MDKNQKANRKTASVIKKIDSVYNGSVDHKVIKKWAMSVE